MNGCCPNIAPQALTESPLTFSFGVLPSFQLYGVGIYDNQTCNAISKWQGVHMAVPCLDGVGSGGEGGTACRLPNTCKLNPTLLSLSGSATEGRHKESA